MNLLASVQRISVRIVAATLLPVLIACQNSATTWDEQQAAKELSAITEKASSGEDVVQESRDAWVPQDKVVDVYVQQCATCHSENYQGSALGPSLLVKELLGGNGVNDIISSIADGNPAKGMPAWQGVMSADEIRSMAIFLLEQRSDNTGNAGMGAGERLELPAGPQASEQHNFSLQLLADGFMHPYSLAVLPDQQILVTEKSSGLTLISADGKQRSLIRNTPKVYNDSALRGTTWAGNGWMQDVALHPDFASNGWIYLSYGDRCSDCNAASKESGQPASMIAVVRGRIRDGGWYDQQTIWQADKSHYQVSLENGMGARIEFDRSGYVYLTLGNMDELYKGVQDLAQPFGKVLRLHDDGRIPKDNPYVDQPNALPEVWALGFRTPQGLAFDTSSNQLWLSEHGPRGGDEANIIEAAENYGWPLTSLGIDYDGSPINYGPKLGIEFDPETLRGPAIDWTPSLGVSNIEFYHGTAFPNWRNNMLVATLKQNDLLRVEIEDGKARHTEVLLDGLGRFRDLAIGPNGEVFLLLEHLGGSRIVKIQAAKND